MNYLNRFEPSSAPICGGTSVVSKSLQPSALVQFMLSGHLAGCIGAVTTGSVAERATPEIRINDKIVVIVAPGETRKKATHLPQQGPSPGPWVDDMLWIKQKGGVTMSSLANLLGVTRKSLYDWIAGSEPRNKRSAQIRVLKGALASLPDRATRSTVIDLIDRRLMDGTTIRSLLNASDLRDEEAMTNRVAHGFAELVQKVASRTKRRSSASIRSTSFESDFPST